MNRIRTGQFLYGSAPRRTCTQIGAWMPLLALVLAFMVSAPSTAQMSDYERSKLSEAINQQILQPDSTVFDGTQFSAGVTKSQAGKYLNDYTRAVNRAVNAVNGLTSSARNSEEGQQSTQRVQQLLNTHKAIKTAYENFSIGTEVLSESSSPDVAISPESTLELAALNAQLDDLDQKLENAIYTRNGFLPEATIEEAESFFQSISDALSDATQLYNNLPSTMRSTRDGNQAYYRLNTLTQTQRVMRSDLISHLEKQRLKKKQLAATEASENLKNLSNRLRDLLNGSVMTDGEFLNHISIETAEQHTRIVQSVTNDLYNALRQPGSTQSQREEANRLWNQGRNIQNTYTRFRATTVRRQAAADFDKRQQALAERTAQMQEEQRLQAEQAAVAKAAADKAEAEAIAVSTEWYNLAIPNYKQMDITNGFIRWTDGPPSYRVIMNTALAERDKGNLSDFHVNAFAAYIDERLDSYPALDKYQPGDVDYAIDLLRTRHANTGITLKSAWMLYPNWDIHRNSLGAILSRSRLGYVTYDDPSGYHCIVRKFLVREEYAGSGLYERTNVTPFQGLRFQACDSVEEQSGD